MHYVSCNKSWPEIPSSTFSYSFYFVYFTLHLSLIYLVYLSCTSPQHLLFLRRHLGLFFSHVIRMSRLTNLRSKPEWITVLRSRSERCRCVLYAASPVICRGAVHLAWEEINEPRDVKARTLNWYLTWFFYWCVIVSPPPPAAPAKRTSSVLDPLCLSRKPLLQQRLSFFFCLLSELMTFKWFVIKIIFIT